MPEQIITEINISAMYRKFSKSTATSTIRKIPSDAILKQSLAYAKKSANSSTELLVKIAISLMFVIGALRASLFNGVPFDKAEALKHLQGSVKDVDLDAIVASIQHKIGLSPSIDFVVSRIQHGLATANDMIQVKHEINDPRALLHLAIIYTATFFAVIFFVKLVVAKSKKEANP